MKTEVNPVAAAIIIIVVLAIAGFALWRSLKPETHYGEKPPGMPPSVAAEFQRRMGGVTPQNGKIPQTNNGGIPNGGYIAPPTAPH
ncbi:hypothetical protein [Chthonomonas calidirosea]|uniref:hypothetical protein n=1 Tax=Chthonomonas calidirosea TaxID=454171 RepID=UPI0006EC5420|nr:hypothetical protein [Chthonomonas calidirosea]CEK16699.1 hypothetical protein CP488_01596 [Chthonomonas calidirosea]